jgi:acyl-lipid omega-6 desaturase (Delta-12 desaturase)
MENTIKKSDFVLTPYMKSNDWRATYQIMNTVVPYILLWVLAIQVAPISYWLLPPIMMLITLFSVRCFSLMHDCGHYSLFNSKRVNRWVGFMLGVINAIPQYPWSRDHAYHHKTNGDWERYRGIADFLSTDEFAKLSLDEQKSYQLLRQPLMAIPGGFFYLAIEPRLALISEIKGFVRHAIDCLKENPSISLTEIIATHKSKRWSTMGEFWDSLLNNICVISGWVIMSNLIGAGLFFSIYSICLTFSAVIFIWVFFVQHIFEGSYAHKTAEWDYLTGAIEGSSYLELPPILKWFTADIGYHNIHHLSERIPNYHVEACHRENIHLLSSIKTLHMSDMLDCAKFILWDAPSDSLITVESFHQASRCSKGDNMPTTLAPKLLGASVALNQN